MRKSGRSIFDANFITSSEGMTGVRNIILQIHFMIMKS